VEIEKLVNNAKNGDKEALIELICNIKSSLYKIARIRLNSDADIEDAVQETIIEAYKNIKNLKSAHAFKSWVTKILINKCNKIYQGNTKTNISYEELELDDFLVDNSTIDSKVDNDSEFYYLLNGLTYDERLAILLYYMEDYPIKEISKMMNLNENTVKTKLKRARDKIKEKYERSDTNG